MSSQPKEIRVCIISPDLALKSALSSVLGPEFRIFAAGNEEAAEPTGSFDAVILDLDSTSGRPEQLTDLFAEEGPGYNGTPIILMASDECRTHALDLVERGAYGYLRKPPNVREVKAMLRRASERNCLKKELESSGRQLDHAMGLDQLIGASAPMQLVYKLIRKVTNLDALVLVTGESGTGKELIAQAIHNVGNRSKRAFVAVSCSAIPETLIEAELFGHEKGAFTGTVGTREGYFEQAGDGTLFLDEIGELKLQTQVKLLRVLQQKEFTRLGSNRPIPLRARIVLATHRDLSQMVSTGEFRQDLFYRINVMNIAAPALRHHAADIPQLVHHFIKEYSHLYRKPIEGIEPDALALLEDYSWPGNVRELGNVIQRAIILAEGHSIQASDLPDSFQQESEVSRDESDDLPSGSFERLIRDYKVKLAHEAIARCNGSKTLAAQNLQISRAYLHRLIRTPSSVPEPIGPEFEHPQLRIAESA
jgi:DNA-binding NtrC family response regulator